MLKLLGIGAGMAYLSGCGPAPATEAPAAAEATATPAAVEAPPTPTPGAVMATGAIANDLTPHVGDANTMIPEYKAFLVDIRKANGK
jgi:hypothetical protein